MDLVWDKTRGHMSSDLFIDFRCQCCIQDFTRLKDDEQQQGRTAAKHFSINDKAFHNFIDRFDDAVDIASPHPYTRTVNGRVGTSINDAAALVVDFYPISMFPYSRIRIE